MTVSFTLASRNKVSTFSDNAHKGDVTNYTLDCSPWAEDNGAMVTAVWTVETGGASISNQTLVSGIAAARVTFNERGYVQLSLLASTATASKKVYLNILVDDETLRGDDYGQC